MEIGDYAYIMLEGSVEAITETNVTINGDTIDLDNITSQRIAPVFDAGRILWAAKGLFYMKLDSGDWVYSFNGSLYAEEYVVSLYEAGNLTEVEPE